MMTLEKFVAMSQAERKAWLLSNEHRYNCAAHSEGLACCLENLAGLTDEDRKRAQEARIEVGAVEVPDE